jgi:hypothetical protein
LECELVGSVGELELACEISRVGEKFQIVAPFSVNCNSLVRLDPGSGSAAVPGFDLKARVEAELVKVTVGAPQVVCISKVAEMARVASGGSPAGEF